MTGKALALVILLSVGLVLSACTPVRAWERGHLARREMAWQPDGLNAALDSHVFFSKEASSGGAGTAGGGCGCN